jgi:hypothetical protein
VLLSERSGISNPTRCDRSSGRRWARSTWFSSRRAGADFEPFLEAPGAPAERLGAEAELDPLVERTPTVDALLDPPRG